MARFSDLPSEIHSIIFQLVSNELRKEHKLPKHASWRTPRPPAIKGLAYINQVWRDLSLKSQLKPLSISPISSAEAQGLLAIMRNNPGVANRLDMIWIYDRKAQLKDIWSILTKFSVAGVEFSDVRVVIKGDRGPFNGTPLVDNQSRQERYTVVSPLEVGDCIDGLFVWKSLRLENKMYEEGHYMEEYLENTIHTLDPEFIAALVPRLRGTSLLWLVVAGCSDSRQFARTIYEGV